MSAPRAWRAERDEAETVARLISGFRNHYGRAKPSDNAILAGVERLEVPGRVLEHDVLVVVVRNRQRRRPGKAGPAQFAARLQPRKDLSASLRIPGRRVNAPHGRDLRRAGVPVGRRT